jgi:hypothetical protein
MVRANCFFVKDFYAKTRINSLFFPLYCIFIRVEGFNTRGKLRLRACPGVFYIDDFHLKPAQNASRKITGQV